MSCGSQTDTVVTRSRSSGAVVDLTCQHKNQTMLAEGPETKIRPVGTCSMRDCFSTHDFQTMIDLYISGATRSQVAQRFGISVSIVKRVLREHGIRKRAAATPSRSST
jgi:hypothetical protein